MEVVEDKVIRPDGTPGIYAYMKILPGIVVLPVDDAGFVYLLKEYHYPTGTKLLKPVSGGRDKGESALKAAKRELKEELGITATKWVPLGSTNAFASTVDGRADMFLAQGLQFGEVNHEVTETIHPVKLKFTKALEMITTGKISNGNTCVLLLKANYRLQRNKA